MKISQEESNRRGELFRKHHQNPEITLNQYRRHKVSELERQISGRKIVYLDSKYWIYLRDPAQCPSPDLAEKLYTALKAGVENGQVICPYSFPLHLELSTQPLNRKIETAQLMDDLSLNICLKEPAEVSMLEFTRFIIENHPVLKSLTGVILPVWTRVGMLFREQNVPRGAMPQQFQSTVEKAQFDLQWEMSITELAKLRDTPLRKSDVSAQINEQRKSFPRAGKTFTQLFHQELYDLLDFNKPLIENSLKDVASGFVDPSELENSSMSEAEFLKWITTMHNAISEKKAPEALPMQRILASLHAYIRMDDNRPFKPNDTNDVRHTSSAMAYCDLFLTERSFAAIANSKEVREVGRSKCLVVADMAEAVDAVQELTK